MRLGGNSGTAKIHDATNGQEAGEQGNEPHVCTFWIGFYTDEDAELGAWEVISWAPTGDGSVAASGTYDTSGDGVYATGIITLDDGHYRLEWQGSEANNGKHKTFWVECEADPVDEGEPTDESDPERRVNAERRVHPER